MLPITVDKRAAFEIHDDFLKLDTVATNGLWKSTGTGPGTLALGTGVGGSILIPTLAVAGDNQFLSTNGNPFAFAAGKPIWVGARVTALEADVNQCNWYFGLASTASGFGPALPASFDGAVFWKAPGSMALQFSTSRATAQTSSTILTLVAGQSYQLCFQFDPQPDSSVGLIRPQVYDETAGLWYQNDFGQGGRNAPTASIAYAGSAALAPLFGVRANAAFAETLQVDWVRFIQMR